MRNSLQSLVLAFCLAFVGCQQIIELDFPDQEPVLVVTATFNPDSSWVASISQSQDVQLSTQPPAVTNATVLIMENGSIVDTLKHDSADIYVSVAGTKPVAGHTYTIHVSAPGFADVSGSDKAFVPIVPYDLVWRDSVTVDQYGYTSSEFTFKIDDPAGENNYFLLSIYQLDTFVDLGDTTIYYSPLYFDYQDPIFEQAGGIAGVVFSDETFNGQTRTIKVQVPEYYDVSAGVKYYGLSTASEAYYRFMKTTNAYYQSSGNPFTEPVRIYSNMSSDMGIFAGISTKIGVIP